MKIYVITVGEYSDYHIVGVTEKRKKAIAYCKAVKGSWNDPRIEVYDTDSMDIEYGNTRPYSVDMWGNGKTEVRALKGDGWDYENAIERRVSYCPHGFFKGNEYSVDVMARDEEHAKKIAVDLIAQYKYEHDIGVKNDRDTAESSNEEK